MDLSDTNEALAEAQELELEIGKLLVEKNARVLPAISACLSICIKSLTGLPEEVGKKMREQIVETLKVVK